MSVDFSLDFAWLWYGALFAVGFFGVGFPMRWCFRKIGIYEEAENQLARKIAKLVASHQERGRV